MTADSLLVESTADRAEGDNATFSWRKELPLAATMVIVMIATPLIGSRFTGRDVRPLPLAGVVLFMTVAFGMGLRRRWSKARHPQASAEAGRFSLAELLAFVTALAFFVGCLGMDRLASQRIQRALEQLQASAVGVLGPDGRITFMPDGSLHLAICDRTFDDARLARLAELIFHWKANAKISGVMFGSGISTNSAPPAWPGITDQSVPLLLQWRDLEMVSVYGTAISENGRKQLRALPHSNQPSATMLAR